MMVLHSAHSQTPTFRRSINLSAQHLLDLRKGYQLKMFLPQALIFLRQASYRYFEVSLYVSYSWAGEPQCIQYNRGDREVN